MSDQDSMAPVANALMLAFVLLVEELARRRLVDKLEISTALKRFPECAGDPLSQHPATLQVIAILAEALSDRDFQPPWTPTVIAGGRAGSRTLMLVLSQNLVLAPPPAAFSANNPVIGWRNIVTVASLLAGTADPAFPVGNLANPATHLLWKATTTAAQSVTASVATTDPIDYLALAGHNCGTAGIALSVEGRASLLDPWTALVPSAMQADDSPYLGRFVPFVPVEIRINFAAGAAPPQAAVLYVGKLTVLERRIYVGHRVLPYNRRAHVVAGESDNGQFLGRIVLSEMTESALDLQNVTPTFYRSELEPWLKSAVQRPFFFAWRPSDYPNEVGYCWAAGDAQMSNQRSNGMVQASLNLRGIVK